MQFVLSTTILECEPTFPEAEALVNLVLCRVLEIVKVVEAEVGHLQFVNNRSAAQSIDPSTVYVSIGP